MNRNEEYRQLLQELDALEAPKDCVVPCAVSGDGNICCAQ